MQLCNIIKRNKVTTSNNNLKKNSIQLSSGLFQQRNLHTKRTLLIEVTFTRRKKFTTVLPSDFLSSTFPGLKFLAFYTRERFYNGMNL